jgi:hypothetical protein
VSVLLELPIAVVERADLTSLQPPVKKYDNKLIRNISKEIRARRMTKFNKIQKRIIQIQSKVSTNWQVTTFWQIAKN